MDKNFIENIIKGKFKGDKAEYSGIIHLKYTECRKNNLVFIDEENAVHKDLYDAFLLMQSQAKKEGVKLRIISGFRSIAEQKIIFVRKFKDKEHPCEKEFIARLKYSAPASYSEHHTGFAVDINSLYESFCKTKAYGWLVENAHKYGFENSFPLNNKQGLGYEPWHWRYTGTLEAKEIFSRARSL